MTITAEDREKLGEELEAIEKVLAGLHEARRPFQLAIELVEGQREVILERYGITDDFQNCEGCNAIVLSTDKAHHCDDGPVLCVECAPTWSEMKVQIEDRIKSQYANPDTSEEDPLSLAMSLQACERWIADGDGDKKHVW